jgi:hypothetical protein
MNKQRAERTEAEAEAEAKAEAVEKRKLTPLTPSYAHMNPPCEWEISIERDSGIGTEQKIDGDDWRRLATTIP